VASQAGKQIRPNLLADDCAGFRHYKAMENRRFFLSLPEVYEILLWDHKVEGAPEHIWKRPDLGVRTKTDSLVRDSWKHCQSRGVTELEVLLDLCPGPDDGWKDSDAVLKKGHTFRLFVANNGPGINTDEWSDFLDRARRSEEPGALISHVVERSKPWCTELRMYFTCDSRSVRSLDLYKVKNYDRLKPCEPLEEKPNTMPQHVWDHFSSTGVCFEFVCRIPASHELTEDVKL